MKYLHGFIIIFIVCILFVIAQPKTDGQEARKIPIEKIHFPYHDQALESFNKWQRLIGNGPAKMNNLLNNAAKYHAIYLGKHFFNMPLSLDFHYEIEGKDGFIGKNPPEQAEAAGFNQGANHTVTNTMSGWFPAAYEEYVSVDYCYAHIVDTMLHRFYVLSPGTEAIGAYVYEKDQKKIWVFFMSFKSLPEEPVVIAYPMNNQKDIPVKMKPEIPDPFQGDANVGYPLTCQLFVNDSKNIPKLDDAWLKDNNGIKQKIYMTTPESKGQIGYFMKLLKLIAITAVDPLKSGEKYSYYLKVRDSKGKIIYDEVRYFTTISAENNFSKIDSDKDYSIDFKNWSQSSHPAVEMMYLAPENTNGTYHENINIVSTPNYHKITDWEIFKTYQLKALQGMLANFKVLSWEKVWLDKKEARLLEYEGEMQGFNLIWLQIYCINNEKFYSVSYVGEKNDYYKHKSEAMKVIETFKFK